MEPYLLQENRNYQVDLIIILYEYVEYKPTNHVTRIISSGGLQACQERSESGTVAA
jgi:hypothetical protein